MLIHLILIIIKCIIQFKNKMHKIVWQQKGSLGKGFLLTSLPLSAPPLVHICRMNSGVCVCVILAALSASCLGRPRSSSPDTDDSPLPSQLDASLSGNHRVVRSTSLTLKQQPAGDTDQDTRANLSELLAKLVSKKGERHLNDQQ